MGNYKVTKLTDADMIKICGGNAVVGTGLLLIGESMAVAGILGFAASEITSTAYVLKANRALNAGNISDGKKFSEVARRAKIAAISCAGAAATGCILLPIGAKINANKLEKSMPEIPVTSLFGWLDNLNISKIPTIMTSPQGPRMG